ncbi:hypothetical protein HGM15179_004467 [Zosterops borbonicus]|uniref:Uncharacterized protein n=1 Tax=Zosterops borbonicus TaxID=364589 RepID=A0A8K1LQR1_9PASS|nr:hypothetical protein HGM15179_004467 [Zosterops borbonicus]
MTACHAQHSLLVGKDIHELARQDTALCFREPGSPEQRCLRDQAAADWSCGLNVSHLMNLTIFHDEMAGLVDERKAVDIYPDFSKAFGIASHKITLEKIVECASLGDYSLQHPICCLELERTE